MSLHIKRGRNGAQYKKKREEEENKTRKRWVYNRYSIAAFVFLLFLRGILLLLDDN